MTSLITHVASEEVKLRLGTEGPAAEKPVTFCEVFQGTVAKFADRPALQYKDKSTNEWLSLNWTEYYDRCTKFAKSLISLEFKPFQSVNIIGFNSHEWLTANNGTILAGGLAAGIYTTNGPEACHYISKHSEAVVVVVEGVPQLQKFLAIADDLPDLKALVMYNADKVPEDLKCRVPIHLFDDFLKLGESVTDEELKIRMDNQKPGNCCTLIYTSGTTGPPKAVMISHDNTTWTARQAINYLGDLNENDRIISYLPLSHIAAQMLDIHAPIAIGACVYFAQPDALKGSLGGTLKEVKPTVFFGVPRVWEKIAEKMWKLSASTTGFKKRIATWAKDKGLQKSMLAQYGNSGGVPCGFGCAHKVVLSKIKAALGLDECRACYTGAAPISMEVLQYFASLDIPIYELFGQSECTGPQTMNMPGRWKLGTCGVALTGTDMKIAESNGEFIYAGRNIMMGYLKMEDKNKETFSEDGWLLSGDVSKIDDDGFMSITGRIKELIITAGGENIPPVLIEDALKLEMKALSNCMVIGDRRKFLTVLLCLREKLDDGKPTGELDEIALGVAQEIGSEAKTIAEAKSCEKFKAYLDNGVKAANEKSTSRAQRIAKWTLLAQDFTVGGNELTPTLKLKRTVVAEKYSVEIEELYAEADAPVPEGSEEKPTEKKVEAKNEKVEDNKI